MREGQFFCRDVIDHARRGRIDFCSHKKHSYQPECFGGREAGFKIVKVRDESKYGRAGTAHPIPQAVRAEGIAMQASRLHWYDWGRYSYSQKERMQLGGLKGTITFAGEPGPFLPYLREGELVNVGQGECWFEEACVLNLLLVLRSRY